MKAKLPYKFVSYFVNDSESNLSENDVANIKQFITKNNISYCSNWEDEAIICKNDLDKTVCECLIFTFVTK